MIVSVAQISPVWLDKNSTIEKIINSIKEAKNQNSDLVAFGEALLPGYPVWLGYTGGAEFNSTFHKEIHAHYISQSIDIENGDLVEISKVAKQCGVAVYLGIVEKAADRGGHSLYCSMVYIDKRGEIASVHRKLQPTYDERLAWAPGDGAGLQVHKLEEFTVGGLNCWENWMPLPRAALYAQGENLHVAIWPGSIRNTEDVTRFIAKESRSFVISSSALLYKNDISGTVPNFDEIKSKVPDEMHDGGSCVAAPTGEWLIEPIVGKEVVFSCEIDIKMVYGERQNFDPSGHYSRPDVTKLTINRERQSVLKLE